MKTKVSTVVLMVLALSLGLALTASARPWGLKAHGFHRGHRGECTHLTPEQAGKLFDLRQKFLDDTASLRKDMVVKRAELRALWRSEKPDQKQILAKLKEIDAVKAKLLEKWVPYRLAVKQILPKRPEQQKQLSLEDESPILGNVLAMQPDGFGDLGL
jgi:Spy/CpxP family protein refolding chaperone